MGSSSISLNFIILCESLPRCSSYLIWPLTLTMFIGRGEAYELCFLSSDLISSTSSRPKLRSLYFLFRLSSSLLLDDDLTTPLSTGVFCFAFDVVVGKVIDYDFEAACSISSILSCCSFSNRSFSTFS
jgi:hypothetical protein